LVLTVTFSGRLRSFAALHLLPVVVVLREQATFLQASHTEGAGLARLLLSALPTLLRITPIIVTALTITQ